MRRLAKAADQHASCANTTAKKEHDSKKKKDGYCHE
jgi:hypothetical protein